MCFIWDFQTLVFLRWEPDTPTLAAVIRLFMQVFCWFKISLLWIRWVESHSNAPCDGRRGMENINFPRCLLEVWRTQPALPSAVLEDHQPTVPGRTSSLCKSTEGCGQSCVFPTFSYLIHAQCNQFPFWGPVPIILGLTLPSEENRRTCCSLGTSSHWSIWIHTTELFPPLLESSAGSNVESLEHLPPL